MVLIGPFTIYLGNVQEALPFFGKKIYLPGLGDFTNSCIF